MQVFNNTLSIVGFLLVLLGGVTLFENEIVNAAIAMVGLVLFLIGYNKKKSKLKKTETNS